MGGLKGPCLLCVESPDATPGEARVSTMFQIEECTLSEYLKTKCSLCLKMKPALALYLAMRQQQQNLKNSAKGLYVMCVKPFKNMEWLGGILAIDILACNIYQGQQASPHLYSQNS